MSADASLGKSKHINIMGVGLKIITKLINMSKYISSIQKHNPKYTLL